MGFDQVLSWVNLDFKMILKKWLNIIKKLKIKIYRY